MNNYPFQDISKYTIKWWQRIPLFFVRAHTQYDDCDGRMYYSKYKVYRGVIYLLEQEYVTRAKKEI